MKQVIVDMLKQRGVLLEDIGKIVLDLQRPYVPSLTLNDCTESVERVIEKREAQYALLTGVTIDMFAEQRLLPEPLGSVIERDDPLFGIDEVIALGITNLYGSVGLTSFGYLDKKKPGIIGKLNMHAGGKVHTFLDDLIAGVAAAASARLAHRFEQKRAAEMEVHDEGRLQTGLG